MCEGGGAGEVVKDFKKCANVLFEWPLWVPGGVPPGFLFGTTFEGGKSWKPAWKSKNRDIS